MEQELSVVLATDTAGVYVVPTRGRRFAVLTTGSAHPEWLLHSFHFEHALREEWWDVRPGDVVVDVGAAYGSYTLAALAADAGLVFAYEPGREELFSLTQNVAFNGWSQRVYTLPFLAGASTEVSPYYPDSHSTVRPEGAPEQRLCLTLDDLCLKNNNLGRLDWVKIDVEGAEVEVLQGALGCLERFHPKLLIENHVGYVPGVDKQVRALLKPRGYKEQRRRGEKGSNEDWSLWQWAPQKRKRV